MDVSIRNELIREVILAHFVSIVTDIENCDIDDLLTETKDGIFLQVEYNDFYSWDRLRMMLLNDSLGLSLDVDSNIN